MEMICFI